MAKQEKSRCDWSYAGMSDAYIEYHDTEWGLPVYDDKTFFEFLDFRGCSSRFIVVNYIEQA